MAKDKEKSTEEVEETKKSAEKTPETVEETTENSTRTGRTVLEAGSEKWNFEQNPEFTGIYVGPHVAEKDGGDAENSYKAGDILGYIFESIDDGETYIISNSHQIERALTKEIEAYDNKRAIDLDYPIYIKYKGQVKNNKGQKVNRFYIALDD